MCLNPIEQASRRLLIIADQDARLAWALSLAAVFGRNGYQIAGCLPSSFVGVPALGHGLSSVSTYQIMSDLWARFEVTDYDVVVLGLGGGNHIKFLTALREYVATISSSKRPIVITGFSGLIDPTELHGLLCRVGSDIICINSEAALTAFTQSLHLLGLPTSSLQLTGYVRDYLNHPAPTSPESIKTVMYVEQHRVLADKYQQEYVIDRINDYARKFPERRVLVKLRKRSTKQGLAFFSQFDLESYWKKRFSPLPGNLAFVDGPADTLLPSVDLLLSFSSTMIIEALILGKRAAVISDLGIQNRYGNQVFVGSGLLTSFSALLHDVLPTVCENWKAQHITFGAAVVAQLIARTESLLASQATSGDALAMPAPAYVERDNRFLYRFKSFNSNKSRSVFSKILHFLTNQFSSMS